jgi:vacuolar protein sorting-associated protein 13A/C
VVKDIPAVGIKASLSAWERLDVNVSTAFAELVMSTASIWGKEGVQVLQKARGSYAPYRIWNRTGSPLLVWPDVEGSSGADDPRAKRLGHDEMVDWRFDDWKTMRGVCALF